MMSVQVIYRYIAAGGGKVGVPVYFNPHAELGVASDASRHSIKQAFKARCNLNSRQRRVMASLAYQALTATSSSCYTKRNEREYRIARPDNIFVLAAAGHTETLMAKISRNRALLRERNEHQHSVLYVVARAGFYDTTEALLKAGASVNDKQVDGSTALHGASFYGQKGLVQLLLKYGADPTVTNRWGNTPASEAPSDDIRDVIRSYKENKISEFARLLMGKGLARHIRFIYDEENKIIGHEVVRNEERLDSETKREWDSIHSRWEIAWHGTKWTYVESIFKNGLLPSGARLPDGKLIQPPSNHYKLGDTHFGIKNWASAMFLSPSILYSSHACYAERITSENAQWCVVLKARVKPASYQKFNPTVYNYKPIDGEPNAPEYTVRNPDASLESIMRVESARSVVVTSVMFISQDFLEGTCSSLNYEEVHAYFAKN